MTTRARKTSLDSRIARPSISRLSDVRRSVLKAGLDALLVTDIKNIRYISGFTGSSAYVLIGRKAGFFFTDSRYEGQARDEVKGLKARICRKAVDAIAKEVRSTGIKKLGFEADHLTYEAFTRLKKALRGVALRPLAGTVSQLRARKDGPELRLIRDSAALLDRGFEAARGFLRPGAVEKAVAWEIEKFLRSSGADAFAFDPIIASGPRGALPHAKASGRRIRKGELVVVDMGVLLNGYNSDETRTYCIGKAGLRQKKIYDTVEEAQSRAIERIRPGALAADVDAGARECIEKAGFGRYFGHGTGHGVGLDVHEAPAIGPGSKDVLEEGMVVTVEPGIYIPGLGGVRIEDMALVVKGGAEIITKTGRGLVCL